MNSVQIKSLRHLLTSPFKTVFFAGELYFPLTLTLTSSKIWHFIFLYVKIVGIRKQNDNRKLMYFMLKCLLRKSICYALKLFSLL